MVQEVLIEEIEVEEVVKVGIEITITIKANIFQMVNIVIFTIKCHYII